MRTGRSTPLHYLLLLASGTLLAAPAPAGGKKHVTFDQVFNNGTPRLTTPLPAVTGWLDDGRYTETRRKEGERKPSMFVVDAVSGVSEPDRDMEKFRGVLPEGIDPASPAASDDARNQMLYAHEGDFWLLNAVTKDVRRLTRSAADRKNPTFSPGGKYVAFTMGNDLYAIEVASGTEYRYTSDGSDVVYNGWASWLYYEEILGRASHYRAFWWSPDGSRIAFYRFDDSRVPVYPLFSSAGVAGSLENTRYPRAGDPNPGVRIGIVPVTGGPVVWSEGNEATDCYFGTPFWTPGGGSFWVQWMNRRQDSLRVESVDPHSGVRKTIYEETQKSWVEWLAPPQFLKDAFILRSDRDGWMHLYVYGMDGRLRSQLTAGSWNVAEVQSVDESAGRVFFTARKESSTRTDLYSVNLDGTGLTRLTFGAYTHAVSVSPRGAYFVTTYSTASRPPRMALCDGTGKVVRDLGDSKGSEFDDYDLGKTELFTIPTSDGYALPAIWTLPPGFDPGGKYPVLISEYGGPNSPSVADGWRGIGAEWLAGEGLIQMSVDHRGSGHFGKTGVALMRGKLGTWEMNDYSEAVRWLRTRGFIDSSRICITGGSYGGYVTCLALTRGADFFTHGVALFSVTDWRLYDSHYVERYMGLPADNPEGYRDASVITYAGKYRGMLRIVHGTMDDNVHVQNSLQLVDTLENLGRHFEFMTYPGERHGWRGPKAVHLRNETYRFYYTYLLRKEFPARLFESAGLAPGRSR